MCGDPQELGCFARRLAVPVPEGQGKGRGRLPRCFCDHTKLVFPSEVSNLADESLMADGLTSFFPALSPAFSSSPTAERMMQAGSLRVRTGKQQQLDKFQQRR